MKWNKTIGYDDAQKNTKKKQHLKHVAAVSMLNIRPDKMKKKNSNLVPNCFRKKKNLNVFLFKVLFSKPAGSVR